MISKSSVLRFVFFFFSLNMNIFIRRYFLFVPVFFMAAFAFLGGVSSSFANCPSYYSPVCGERNGRSEVFQNICTMNASRASFISWGSCSRQYNNNAYPYYSNTSYYGNYRNNSNNRHNNYYSSARCVHHAIPHCEYGYRLVEKGYSSNGCKNKSVCEKVVYSKPFYTQNRYTQYSGNHRYTKYYGDRYSQYVTNVHDFQNPIHNYSSIEISRNKNSRSHYTLALGSEFTLTLIPQDSYGNIMHTIPEGIELIRIKKGNCSISSGVGYGSQGQTKLFCSRSEGVQYTARVVASSPCTKSFSTKFEGRHYSPVWKTLSVTLR